jgi:signal peptidase I
MRWIRIAWLVLGIVAVAVAVLAIAGSGGDDGGGNSGSSASLQTYEVPNKAMLPTYAPGSKVKVNQGAYAEAAPVIGDVVVFHPPVGGKNGTACDTVPEAGEPCPRPASIEASRIAIERVVARPGETVAIKDGNAVVNGKAQSLDAETRPCTDGTACNLPKAIKIRAGEYFVLGDNRQASDDSRARGPIPAGWIIGKVEDPRRARAPRGRRRSAARPRPPRRSSRSCAAGGDRRGGSRRRRRG